MPIENEIYEFERVLSDAIQKVLDAVELNTLSVNDPPLLEYAQPRCEVSCGVGGSIGNLLPENLGVPGSARELNFEGKISVVVVTGSEEDTGADIGKSKLFHYSYLARVRNTLQTVIQRVNSVILLNHAFYYFKSSGTTYSWKPELGYYETELEFDIKFSINIESLNQL